MSKALVSPKTKQVISLVVLMVFAASMLPACGGGDPKPTTQATTTPPAQTTPMPTTTAPPATTPLPTTTSDTVTGLVTPDNLRVSGMGVSLELPPVALNEQASVTITPAKNLPLLGEIEVAGYDFKIETDEEIAGMMTLTIPYDRTRLEPGVSPYGQVGAAYYNQSTGQWESVLYEIDEASGSVIISTSHLSVFGAFVVGRQYTRAAYVEYTLPRAAIRAASAASVYDDVISEAIDRNMVPGPSALELGNSIVSEWLGISGAGLTALSNTIYATEFLDGIGNAMTNLGLLSAIAQAAVDYQAGDNTALYGNLIKNLTNFAISKFGTAMMQLGSVGVFCIDYSLNKFATEAISGRKDIYQEAYRLYYASEGGVRRTARDWYYVFMPMAKTARTPAELNTMVMAEIDRYAAQFWQDELTVAFYQDQAMKNGFTGGGGLNQSIKTELSNNFKFELLQGMLQSVFGQISRRMAAEQEEQVNAELKAIARELNKIVTIQVYDSGYDNTDPKPQKARYAGYIARIAPLADEVTDKERWQQVIDDQGKAQLPFRVLGHIMAGSPNKIEIVAVANPNEVVKTVQFKVAPPAVRIDVTDEEEKEVQPQLYTNTRTAKIYNGYFIVDISFSLTVNRPFALEREVIAGDALGLLMNIEKYNGDIVINVEAIVTNLRFSESLGYSSEYEPVFKEMYWSVAGGDVAGSTATVVITPDGRGIASFGYSVIIDIHHKPSDTYSWGGGSTLVSVTAVVMN